MTQVLKLLSQKLSDRDMAKNAAYVLKEAFGKSESMHKAEEVLDNMLDKASVENYFKTMRTKVHYSYCKQLI